MADQDHIPMPSKAERDASIQAVLDQGLSPTRPSWRNIPLSVLVFGVEDCLFLASLLGLLPAAAAFIPAESLADLLAKLLFLSSPLLYIAACALTSWKESLSGTLDWKRTCRLPLQTLTALRMLLFGGASLLVCVPVNLLLWQASGHAIPLSRALAISFSSLFLHAALSLSCRRLRWGMAVPAAAWTLVGIALLAFEPLGGLLPEVPTAVFCLMAGAGLSCCLTQERAMLRAPHKGGPIYAFR
ncbi:MAG: hypothetical protein HFF69_03575 [Oscillospiraceae bacterium]|jgi:hypothetical protein|nr:hypothetical protein [Oscillospiraceae bacterium]